MCLTNRKLDQVQTPNDNILISDADWRGGARTN